MADLLLIFGETVGDLQKVVGRLVFSLRLALCLTSRSEVNSVWIKVLNVERQNYETLRIQETILEIAMALLNKGTKTIKWKEWCDKFDYVDMEFFFSQKDTIEDRNSLVTECENVCCS